MIKCVKARNQLKRDQRVIDILKDTIYLPLNSFRDTKSVLLTSAKQARSQIQQLSEQVKEVNELLNECQQLGNNNGISWQKKHQKSQDQGMPTKLEPYDVRVRINGKLKRMTPKEFLKYQQEEYRRKKNQANHSNILAKDKFEQIINGLSDTLIIELREFAQKEMKTFIEASNIKARKLMIGAPQDVEGVMQELQKEEDELMHDKYHSLKRADEIISTNVGKAQDQVNSLEIKKQRRVANQDYFFGTIGTKVAKQIESQSDQEEILDSMDIDTHPRGGSFMDVDGMDHPLLPRKHESSPLLGRMSLLENPTLPKFPGALNRNLEVTQIDSPRMEPSRPPIIFEEENQQETPTLAQSPSFGELLPPPESEQEKSSFAKEEKPSFKSIFKKKQIEKPNSQENFNSNEELKEPLKSDEKSELSKLEPQKKENSGSIFTAMKSKVNENTSVKQQKSQKSLFSSSPFQKNQSAFPQKKQEPSKPALQKKQVKKEEKQQSPPKSIFSPFQKNEKSSSNNQSSSACEPKKEKQSPFTLFQKKQEGPFKSNSFVKEKEATKQEKKQAKSSVFGKNFKAFTSQTQSAKIFNQATNETSSTTKSGGQWKGWGTAKTTTVTEPPKTEASKGGNNSEKGNVFMKAINKTSSSGFPKPATPLENSGQSNNSSGTWGQQKSLVWGKQNPATWGKQLKPAWPQKESNQGGWPQGRSNQEQDREPMNWNMSKNQIERKSEWKSQVDTKPSFTQMRK